VEHFTFSVAIRFADCYFICYYSCTDQKTVKWPFRSSTQATSVTCLTTHIEVCYSAKKQFASLFSTLFLECWTSSSTNILSLLVWLDNGIEPKSTDYEADTLKSIPLRWLSFSFVEYWQAEAACLLFRFRYSFSCQGTLTRRQRSPLFGLRVRPPHVPTSLTTQK